MRCVIAQTSASALLALFFSMLVGVRAMPIGRKLGLLDIPDGRRKFHHAVTPLVGGAAIVPCALAAVALLWLAPGATSTNAMLHLSWFVVGVGSMFLLGVADDLYGLGPRFRLLFGAMVFVVVVSQAPHFRVGTLDFGGAEPIALGLFATLFTVICLVGLLNAVNMADGKNGLVISLSLIWTLALWAHAPMSLAPVLAGLAVSLMVMLGFNMAGRLFLGDGGSYGLSAIMGLLAVYIYNANPMGLRAEMVALMFAVPVFDTLRLVVTRAREGISPFAPDRDHLHHHLAAYWGWPRGLILYLALVGLPNMLAALVPALGVWMLALTLVAYALLLRWSMRAAMSPDIGPLRG